MSKKENTLEKLVGISDLVDAFKVSRSTVIRAITNGELPAYQRHKKAPWRIREADAHDWMMQIDNQCA